MGSGKSSLLEALLGEILPLQRDGGNAAQNGPRLHGSIAYCSQVPWIVSGTLRVRSTPALHPRTVCTSLAGTWIDMCMEASYLMIDHHLMMQTSVSDFASYKDDLCSILG